MIDDPTEEQEFLFGVIAMMRTLKTEAGELVFPHLDPECLTAIGKLWMDEVSHYARMSTFEATARAYHRVVHTSHPRIH